MGFLFNNDNKDSTTDQYGGLNELPEDYYIRDGVIYDNLRNPVSLSYHSIDFPKAKIGATTHKLIEKNGFFIPKSNTKLTWKKSLRAAVKSKTPKGYLEAIHEHHGPCPDRVKDDYYIRKSIRLHGGTEMYGKTEYTPENKRKLSQDEPTRIIENTIKKSENDKKELSVDYDNLIIVIKAYVCGVLVENTTDWMILSNEYNTLFEIIDKHISKQKPVETLKYAESFMDIYIPHEEYKKISQLSKLDKPNIQQLTEIEQKLEQQILLN